MNTYFSPRLFQIVSVCKYLFQTSEYTIRGVKDTTEKVVACYLSLKFTDHTKREVAKFYQINPDFMEKNIIDLKTHRLVYPEQYKGIEELEGLIQDLIKVEVNE